jgi:FkbM family methyltransferase
VATEPGVPGITVALPVGPHPRRRRNYAGLPVPRTTIQIEATMKKLLKDLAQRFGYDIQRLPTDPVVRRQLDLLAAYGIDLIFDVGANAGQFGQRMRQWGYTGGLVSFEPLPDAYRQLCQLAKKDPQWQTANLALGNYDGETSIHVSHNSYSSSILDILPAHVASAPDSAYVREEIVPIRRLDTILDDYIRPGQRLFVKIDTQGFERQVLEGSRHSMDRISGFQMELSLTPLYEGETLMQEMIQVMKEYGFTLKLLEGGHADYKTGELLQVEGYFYR